MPVRGRRAPDLGTIYKRTVKGVDRGWAGQINEVRGGKRKRHTVYGATEAEVIAKMKELRKRLDELGHLEKDITVEKWLRLWLADIAITRVKPGTYSQYEGYVNRYLVPALGKIKLSKLTPAHVREMNADLTSRLSTTTARNAHRILAVALADAHREDRVTRVVTRHVDAPPKAAGTRKNFTAEQARTILRAAADDPMASRWLFALLYGARQGECLGLRWSDIGPDNIDLAWSLARIDWRHGCKADACGKRPASCPKRRVIFQHGSEHIHIRDNIYLQRPKTASSIRVLPRLPIVDAALELRWQTVQKERPNYAVDFDLVFCQPNGYPLEQKKDWTAWKSLLSKAQVDPATLHAARHTSATLLLEAGVSDKVAASIMGHSDVITTKSYQHVDTSLARSALSGVADRLALTE